MDEELKTLLKENLEISRESLKILKGIRRSNRLSFAFKIFYWLVILGAVAGTYYFLEPYIKSALGVVQQFQQVLPENQKINGTQSISPDTLKNIPSDLLKNLQNLFKTK